VTILAPPLGRLGFIIFPCLNFILLISLVCSPYFILSAGQKESSIPETAPVISDRDTQIPEEPQTVIDLSETDDVVGVQGEIGNG
jgi:hypothetical protein